ncbi:MAG: aminotransferase class IV [Burkholderiales bacterium]|nr:aminotransferase class IV [Burkholderiales bacterium]
MRISFLNGDFVNHEDAYVHIDDRGMLFADGIYEVTLFANGKLIDNDWHLDRLNNSLAKIGINNIPYTHKDLTKISLDLLLKNNITTGSVYLQVTRGVAPRNQLIPKNITPTVIMTVSEMTLPSVLSLDKINKAILEDDIRWQMCDVKSTGLLVGSLLKQKAADNNCDDAILVRNGFITECTFSNLFIVDSANNLITRNLDNFVLPGVTRKRIIELAKLANINVIEKAFSIDELLKAKEVFSSSTTLLIRPFILVNGIQIGDGNVGEITRRLFTSYLDFLNT